MGADAEDDVSIPVVRHREGGSGASWPRHIRADLLNGADLAGTHDLVLVQQNTGTWAVSISLGFYKDQLTGIYP
jgi:hypothetical protein